MSQKKYSFVLCNIILLRGTQFVDQEPDIVYFDKKISIKNIVCISLFSYLFYFACYYSLY